MQKYDVVQFNERIDWVTGCLGMVSDVKQDGTCLVAIKIPNKGTAFVYAKPDEIEYIGPAHLVPKEM